MMISTNNTHSSRLIEIKLSKYFKQNYANAQKPTQMTKISKNHENKSDIVLPEKFTLVTFFDSFIRARMTD